MTALVEIEKTKGAILALSTMPASKMKLPYFKSTKVETAKRIDLELSPFKAWMTLIERNDKLDYHDPRGLSAFSLQPSFSIIDSLNLEAIKPISHEWQDSAGKLVFRFSNWGSLTSQSVYSTSGIGYLCCCSSNFMSEILSDKYNLMLIIKLKYPDFFRHSVNTTYFHDENSYAVQLITLDNNLKFNTFIPTKKQQGLIDNTKLEKLKSFSDRYEYISNLSEL